MEYGTRMKSYGQFCPVAQSMELLGERWTLLVVRELLLGSTRFSELERGVPLMSKTLLAQRLATLVDAGVIERRSTPTGRGHSYHLTAAGQALRPIVDGCGEWAVQWLRRDLTKEELDAGLLMWDMQRNIHLDRIPESNVLVQFFLPDAGRGKTRFWLHLLKDHVDLCLTHPGFEVELEVESMLRTLTNIWLGRLDFEDQVRAGSIRLAGDRRWIREFPTWLRLSGFAGAGRASYAEGPPNGDATRPRARAPRGL
jgi:DNA-binding HxlR family transcriptional regulator